MNVQGGSDTFRCRLREISEARGSRSSFIEFMFY
jgi:hypothetical protein